MKSSTKIAAFTMMDVLTGMVVMSIVIAMVFYLISAVMRQVHDYSSLRLELNTYLVAKADLERKVGQAASMEKMPDGFRLVGEEGIFRYALREHFLLCIRDEYTDTLCHNVVKLETIPVPGVPNENLLSAVLLQLQFGEQVLSCYLYKDYGITEPLNALLIREF